MSLFDSLSKIAEQIKQHRDLMDTSEATVEQVSVLPFIDALGYVTHNPAEVRRQYAILNLDAVDFAILRNDEPMMVIEAKKASESLTKHWKQLFEYFNADKARIGILTNGIQYRFYTDGVKQNIMDDEPFLNIDLLNLNNVSVAHMHGFTKTRFHPDHSLRKIKISNLLARELRQPTDEFVRYFAKQVHSGSLWQNVIEEYRQIVKQCWDEVVQREIARHVHPPRPDPDPIGPNPPITDTNLPKPQTWLDGSVEIPVYASWNDHNFEATLRLRGKIANVGNLVLWDGKWLNPLLAGEAARKTIDPNTTGYVKGMTFWRFRDPADESLRPIMDLHYGWHDDWDLILRVIKDAKQ